VEKNKFKIEREYVGRFQCPNCDVYAEFYAIISEGVSETGKILI